MTFVVSYHNRFLWGTFQPQKDGPTCQLAWRKSPTAVYLAASLISKTRTSTELLVAGIYGSALVSLFGASSAYHFCTLFPTKSRYHDLLHYFDRLVIFVFIAASYTPWLVLREFEMDIGLLVLKAIWTTALGGAVYQYFYREKPHLLPHTWFATGYFRRLSEGYVWNSNCSAGWTDVCHGDHLLQNGRCDSNGTCNLALLCCTGCLHPLLSNRPIPLLPLNLKQWKRCKSSSLLWHHLSKYYSI
ncbi:Monocyte to macrophage differentiation factor 2 [Echinococcus multilocularis]|uniref:Monocyte to macrophage differentiation factor 2 n=1 Tax=Echinococcus multilocularis TaxID=6211 RepID=A0A087VY25_ECHMU|nr:Monocyte to macrophage differentiation factor 2 [Echinococcus multilocularis]